eukprot:7635648-Pyramimonas_sp.AAC.1
MPLARLPPDLIRCRRVPLEPMQMPQVHALHCYGLRVVLLLLRPLESLCNLTRKQGEPAPRQGPR